tara:strand:+ start:64 stop:321 length:258 start_codon:yes stop_codon:yes gene_type:complete
MKRKSMHGKKRSCFAKQKLSPKAAAAKAVRDLDYANSSIGKKHRRESQQKHRDNPGNSHLDYDHTTDSFVTPTQNRGGFGKGTKP